MTIHFICVGNTYRSRMAEAYLNSLKVRGLRATSSGIKASEDQNGPISWVAARIIKKNNLIPFMSRDWQQTSKELLETSQLVIFFGEDYKDFCSINFTPALKSHEVWEIGDIDLVLLNAAKKNKTFDDELIKQSEETFEKIKEKVDALVTSMQ